jgi:hypothetical protein
MLILADRVWIRQNAVGARLRLRRNSRLADLRVRYCRSRPGHPWPCEKLKN